MVRPPSIDSNGMKKGAWSEEEDNILRAYVEEFGHPNWRLLPLFAGLARCGKSCRLRWVNYLKPDLKRGKFTKHEEDLIIKLHDQLGNKWSAIAAYFPGRTDNDIKNYWHAHIKKRGKASGAVTRVKTPQEEQSSEISDCITTDDHQEEPASENVFPQGLSTENHENIHALNSVADSYSVAEPYQTCFSHDYGLCQNDMSTFVSDSSDGGITSWNSTTVESQGNLWTESLEEDIFYNMVLW